MCPQVYCPPWEQQHLQQELFRGPVVPLTLFHISTNPTCCGFHGFPTLCLDSVLSKCSSHPFPSGSLCSSAVVALAHCQPCFPGQEGSRASGKEERSQMQESSEVTLLHGYLSFAFTNSWVIITAKTCSAKWVGEEQTYWCQGSTAICC